MEESIVVKTNSFLRNKKLLKYLIKISVSIVLFYIIIKDVDFETIINSIQSAKWEVLVIAFSLHFVGFYLSALRWRLLLTTQGVKPQVSYLIRSNLIATFFNQFLPSTIGGDSVRAYDSWRLGKNKANAISVIFIDRFLGILVLLLFASITVFFADPITSKVPFLHVWIIGSGLLALFAILFMFFPNKKIFEPLNKIPISFVKKINQKILKLADSFWQFRNHKKVLFKAFLISIFLQANVVLYYYLISHSLIFGISFVYFFLMVPLSIFIMMLPISINGIGLRENIFFLFLSNFSIHASDAIAFAWIEFLFIIVLGLIGGLVYAFRK